MRYIIGIDLGTTNCCVAYVDTQAPHQLIQPFPIPQLKEAGYVVSLPTLPSFCYLTSPHEWSEGALDLPWAKHKDYFVGTFASSQGAKVPTRLIQSAKSWLCHSAARRRDKILPVDAADDALRISPVEATARYLSHIKKAWDHQMAAGDPTAEFQEQEIILTVPASFDEVARSLTVEAARQAGFQQMTLLEEPQAAFYSWIAQHEKKWDTILRSGHTILVCDVGGGTSDFSLIEVTEKQGVLSFQRMAVGDHLLLGGDNMDAALAHAVASKMTSHECSPQQWLQLRHECRLAKEILLSSDTPNAIHRIVLQGTGSSIIQSTLSVEITREEIQKLLSDGFFGFHNWDEARKLRKSSGLRSMGLPYEEEPSLIKHIAHFLHQAGDKKPDFVLFNGGALKPSFFRQAVLHALQAWFPETSPKELSSYHLDLAVSRGAAYYGKARRGDGVRIGGGAARGYYLAIEKDGRPQALTLLPRGSEEGSIYEPEETFRLVPNQPVSFQLLSSHVRLHDVQGSFVDIDPEQMQALPPIHTLLRYGKGAAAETSKEKIPVHLRLHLTPIGTLELELKSLQSQHHWTLEFQVRSSSGQDNAIASLNKARQDETLDASILIDPKQLIASLYSRQASFKPGRLMEKLEELLHRPRKEWPPSVLRGLWAEVCNQAPSRKGSTELEGRWWNLAGFLLRPGYGYPLDDFQIKELWKIILHDLKAQRPEEVQIQSWICFRRIAGGLNRGQQMQIATELLSGFLSKSGKIELKNKSELYPYTEKVRTLAAFELIDQAVKIKLGHALLGRPTLLPAELWALGRLGARQLMHGTLGHVIPRDVCSQWIDRLLALEIPAQDSEMMVFTLGQLARKTEHKELNLPDVQLQSILKKYETSSHYDRLKTLLYEETTLTQQEQEQFFGENLPLGLSI